MKFPRYSSFAKKINTVNLSEFKGVDFTSSEYEMDFNHSPDCQNMYLDKNNNLVKRPGYEVLYTFDENPNGIFVYPRALGNELILHVGTCLYKFSNNSPVLLYSEMTDQNTKGFVFEDKLYILGGNRYVQYDGQQVQRVRDIAYTPTTFIGRSPSGGGTRLEYPNLVSDNRINSFIADGESVNYKTDAQAISSINKITVNGNTVSSSEYMIGNNGTVIFYDPPQKASDGIDNVIIDFNCGTGSVYLDIERCDTFGIFGGKNDSRVFFSGLSNFENVDFQSGLYDATYFPSSGYTKLGSNTTKIMGYVKGDNCQIIVKSDNDTSATHYRRTFDMDENENVFFPIAEGIEGVGAINKSFVNFGGRPLYLSKEGVMCIQGTDVSSRYIVKNVSVNINGRLLNENNLESAEMFVCDDKLFLCVNGNVYLADGRYFASKGYEWFYFTGLNIKKIGIMNDDIYFLTNDKKLCKMYKDNNYSDAGQAIDAYWKTPVMQFQPVDCLKNIFDVQVGFLSYKNPYYADIYYIDEAKKSKVLEDISILASENKMPYNVNTKVKLFDNICFQLMIENNQTGHYLGIEKIIINYSAGKKMI